MKYFLTSVKEDSKFSCPLLLLGSKGFDLFSSSLTTLLFPFRVHPFTDGYSWPRREGYERHAGVRKGEELTDNDDDDDVQL